MAIELYFQKIHLGTLSFDNGKFVYNSDMAGEYVFKKENPITMGYTLFNSHDFAADKIFIEFMDFVRASDRRDFVEDGDIKPEDDLYTKLYKVAGVLTDTNSFYIRQS